MKDAHTVFMAASMPRTPSDRISALLGQALSTTPRMNIERARYFTASLKSTEGQPLPLRWARAMVKVMEAMEIHILPQERIVGRFGAEGRYGIFYPELEGTFFAQNEERFSECSVLNHLTSQDIDIIRRELLPYWSGRTYRECMAAELSPQIKLLMYADGDIFSPTFIIHESATLRHSLQWVLDYDKVLTGGFVAVEEEARQRMAALEGSRPDAQAFYLGVIELCQGIRCFSERYAAQAEMLAVQESSSSRRQELVDIASRCRHVPYYPARNFPEAVQAQWFTQFISRIEQLHGANISNGRIDQYLWRYYQQDIDTGRLTAQEAREYLDHLWCNIAQILRLQLTPGGEKIYQDFAHWEATTIGGQLADGTDAANSLSYLVLESAVAFPLDYPYLCVRIHAGASDVMLTAIADAMRRGKNSPVLINDEEIIPLLEARGVALEEARDYSPSGYSEVRLINRNTYLTGTTWLNLAAVLEMTLSDGRCSSIPSVRLGLSTGDPAHFASFDELLDAFFKQLAYVQGCIIEQQHVADSIRSNHVAGPLLSCLHTLCMRYGMDINSGPVPESLNIGGFTGITGLATVTDSLAVIKSLVYDKKTVNMNRLLEAVSANFEGNEPLRQLCIRCPKYGTGDALTTQLAKRIDHALVSTCHSARNFYGGTPEIFYVPVTTHTAMGRISGATPDGRRAGEALSFGAGPTQGSAELGPTVVLATDQAAKNPELNSLGSRVLDLHFCPRTVRGENGISTLCSLIRAWCRQRHWYLRVHVRNQKDLALLKNNPEKFRDILLREPGLNGQRGFITPAVVEHMFSSPNQQEASNDVDKYSC